MAFDIFNGVFGANRSANAVANRSAAEVAAQNARRQRVGGFFRDLFSGRRGGGNGFLEQAARGRALRNQIGATSAMDLILPRNTTMLPVPQPMNLGSATAAVPMPNMPQGVFVSPQTASATNVAANAGVGPGGVSRGMGANKMAGSWGDGAPAVLPMQRGDLNAQRTQNGGFFAPMRISQPAKNVYSRLV